MTRTSQPITAANIAWRLELRRWADAVRAAEPNGPAKETP